MFFFLFVYSLIFSKSLTPQSYSTGFFYNKIRKSSSPIINISVYIIIKITRDLMMQNRQAKKRGVLFVSKCGPCS